MNPAVTYLDGWYGEEHDGAQPFRWMGRAARCRLELSDLGRPAWLRVLAGHSSPGASPSLTVVLQGHVAGRHTILPDASYYLFPIEPALLAGARLDVELVLDSTFSVEGDSRDLGIAVRTIDVVVAEAADADGWHGWEHEEYFPFRWMGTQAALRLPPAPGRFLSLPVATDTTDGDQVLSLLSAGGDVVADLPLFQGWHVYDVPLPETGFPAGKDGPAALDVTFRVNHLAPPDTHTSDPRDLGVRVGPAEIHDDARRHVYAERFYQAALAALTAVRAEGVVRPVASGTAGRDASGQGYLPQDADGWYWWEFQDVIPFRWMKLEARVTIPAGVRGTHRLCTVPVFSEYGDQSQVLTIAANDVLLAHVPLSRCWDYHTLGLPESPGDLVLTLRLNKLVQSRQHPGDARDLGVRVGPLHFLDDDPGESSTRFERENTALNRREMEAGATVLSSYPLNLGIDLYAKCNINPPCVYCLWDRMKETEGAAASVTVDDHVLEEYAEFFRAAHSLTNCSFGEPLLHPRLAQILDLLENHHKTLELSTNGQAFTPASVEALAGRPMVLYVSLDSATAATYARLRNDRWDDVVTGLTYLRDARRRSNGLPKLNLVFMPMRANRHDLEAYFKLCRMVDASLLVLRPLLRLERSGIVVDRGGYHYDYDREHLSARELDEVFRESEQLSRRYRVAMASQFDFGKYQE